MRSQSNPTSIARVLTILIAIVALGFSGWFGIHALGGNQPLASVPIPIMAPENLPDTPAQWRGRIDYRALDRQLTALVSKALTGNAGINSLSDIGIKTDRSGTLLLDTAKLDAVLSSDPDAVEALFNPPRDGARTSLTDPGLAVALDEIRDAAIAPGGLIEGLSKTLQAEATAIARNRNRMETREDAYEARLQKQYATLDAKLSAFKATQTYLEQQIKLWSNEK